MLKNKIKPKSLLKKALAGVCAFSMVFGSAAAYDIAAPKKAEKAEAAVSSLSVGDEIILPAVTYNDGIDNWGGTKKKTPEIFGKVIAANRNYYTIQTGGLTAGRYPSITDEETEDSLYPSTEPCGMGYGNPKEKVSGPTDHYLFAHSTADAADPIKGFDYYNDVTIAFVRKYKNLFVTNTHLYLENASTIINKATSIINNANSKYSQFGASNGFMWTKDENEGSKGNVTGITTGTKTSNTANYNTNAVIAPAFRMSSSALKYFSENEDGRFVCDDTAVPEDGSIYPGDKLSFTDMKKPNGSSKKDVIEGFVVGETPTAYIIQTTGVDAGPWPGGLGTASSGTSDYTFATEEGDILNPNRTAINKYHTYTKAFYEKYSFLFDGKTKLYMAGFNKTGIQGYSNNSNHVLEYFPVGDYTYNDVSSVESNFSSQTNNKVYGVARAVHRLFVRAGDQGSAFGATSTKDGHSISAWYGTPDGSGSAYISWSKTSAIPQSRVANYVVAPAFNLSKSALSYLTKDQNKTGVWNVSGTPVTMTGITGVCTKSHVQEGDVLTADDFIVTANYSDGTSKEIAPTDYTVSVRDNSAGTQPVTITYNGSDCIVNVVFKKTTPDLESIQATNDKTYYTGTVPPISDFTVKGVYSDGSVASIASSECTITAPDTTEGTHDVTIKYGDLSTTVPVTFVTKPAPVVISSISATCKNGNGEGYLAGSDVPNSEFDVKAIYSDGTYKTLEPDDFTVSIPDKTKGTKPATIQYGDYKTIAYVTFSSERPEGSDKPEDEGKVPTSLTAVCNNNRIVEGDSVTASDFTVSASYSDGSVLTVPSKDVSVTLTDPDATKVGTHNAVVTYKGVSATTTYQVWKLVNYDPDKKISDLRAQIDNLNKQLQAKKAEADAAIQKRDEYKSQLDAINAKLQAALESTDGIDTTDNDAMIDELKAEREKYKQQIADLNKKLKDISDSLGIDTSDEVNKDDLTAIKEKAEKYDEILSHYSDIINKLVSGADLTEDELKTIAGGSIITSLEDEITRLNNVISQKESAITELQKKLGDAENTNKVLTAELKKAQDDLTTAQNKVKQLQDTIDANNATIAGLRGDIAQAQADVKAAQDKQNELSTQLAEEKAKFDKTLDDLNKANDANKPLADQLAMARQALQDASDNYAKLKATSDAQAKDLDKAKQDLIAAQKKVDDLEAQNKSLTENNVKLNDALTALQADLNRIGELNKQLDKDLKDAQALNKANETKINSLTNSVKDLTDFINTLYVLAGGDLTGKTTAQVEDALKRIMNNYLSQQKELEKYKEAIRKIDIAIGGNGSTDPATVADKTAEAIKNGTGNNTSDITALNKQIADLNKQITDLNTRNKSLSDNVDALTANIKGLTDANNNLTDKNKKLTDKNGTLSDTIDSLNDKIKDLSNRKVKTVIKEVPVTKIKTVTKKVPVTKVKTVTKKVPVVRTKIVTKTTQVPVTKVVTKTKEVPVTKVINGSDAKNQNNGNQQGENGTIDPNGGNTIDPNGSNTTDPNGENTIDPNGAGNQNNNEKNGKGTYVPEVNNQEQTASGDAQDPKTPSKHVKQEKDSNVDWLPIIILGVIVAAVLAGLFAFLKKKNSADTLTDDDEFDDDIEDEDDSKDDDDDDSEE